MPGIRPEDGRSAILAASQAVVSLRHGRLEGEGTVNVGTISGGSAINVVPERCELLAEVRGVDDEHGEELAAEIVERIHEAANRPECECDVDISVQRTFSGYRLSPEQPAGRRPPRRPFGFAAMSRAGSRAAEARMPTR